MYHVIETMVFGKVVYGIAGGGVSVPDLSTDREAVAALIGRCEAGDLAPWQLWDVAQDWVEEGATVGTTQNK